MTFMLKNKTSGDIIEKCERLEVTKELDNWGDDRVRSSIDIYHVADKGEARIRRIDVPSLLCSSQILVG